MEVIEAIKRLIGDESAKPNARSLLDNPHKYFLQFAVILRYQDYFRLLVIHKNRVLTDQQYKTLKGAKIAFFKFFGRYACKKYDKPEWSEFFEFEESKAIKIDKRRSKYEYMVKRKNI